MSNRTLRLPFRVVAAAAVAWSATMISTATAAPPAPPSAAPATPVVPATRVPKRRGWYVLPTGTVVEQSVARRWNEALLGAIRIDFSRPTVHARNLFHTSILLWDAWAAYDGHADQWLVNEKHTADDVQAAREEAMSYAAYRLLRHRFAESPGAPVSLPSFDGLMDDLGYDKDYEGTIGDDPASFGNRLAAEMIAFGLTDGSNEQNDYENQVYLPVNEPIIPDFPGNPTMTDPNRWQPISIEYIDQGGIPIPTGYPPALSPEWGIVVPFSLDPAEASIYQRDGFDWWVYHDPGPPPQINGVGDDYYKWGFAMVAIWEGHNDPTDGVMWDVSPATIGNAPLPEIDDWASFYNLYEGGDWGTGYELNPVTGEPYQPQIVPRGDYTRILAEFWADGPASETPPGHWFTILNYVSDHPLTEKRIAGVGPIVDDLEWDVKAYLMLAGGMHDCAVACWGTKGWYDYIRPISAIRYMSDHGQSSDPQGPLYDPQGLPLHPGRIEVITEESIQPGERHEHLAGDNDENVGKIAMYTWRGPAYIDDPEVDDAGCGWILAANFWPYQRPTFVSPPFPGYYSGHSTYSRTASQLMTSFTGSEFFPGGMGEFFCPENEFLVFEEGPSMDVTLQWARYVDASDQTSLSRIWGGIHPPADDLPGRHVGNLLAPEVWLLAREYYNGTAVCPGDTDDDAGIGFSDLLDVLSHWGECPSPCAQDLDLDGQVGVTDLPIILGAWGPCP